MSLRTLNGTNLTFRCCFYILQNRPRNLRNFCSWLYLFIFHFSLASIRIKLSIEFFIIMHAIHCFLFFVLGLPDSLGRFLVTTESWWGHAHWVLAHWLTGSKRWQTKTRSLNMTYSFIQFFHLHANSHGNLRLITHHNFGFLPCFDRQSQKWFFVKLFYYFLSM